MFRARYLVLVGLCLVAPSVSEAQAPSDRSQDELAIRAAAKEYLMAKRRGDSEALANIWTPDGDYVDAAGKVFQARELVRWQVSASATTAAPEPILLPESSLRFITPDVAIEDGSSEFAMADDGTTLLGRFTAVWAKRNGRWWLDSLREATIESPAVNEHLRPLEWLLGEWVGTGDEAVILVSSQWSDGGQYIVREFLVRGDGRPAVSGTQRIGWDPVARQIKSWTFDSQGGSSEGIWRPDGERWLVESTDVLADGKKSKTLTAYAPGDDGQFTIEVKSTWDIYPKSSAVNLPTLRVEFQRAPEAEDE
jgi:uncharacterized protein (TIGR02246 family)